MTYTLNDHPIGLIGQCAGTTKNGERCRRRGHDILGHGFWCPAHGTINGPLLPESNDAGRAE